MNHGRPPAHYRSAATRLRYRRPLLLAVLKQFAFWTIVNAMLVAINHLVIQAVSATYTPIAPPPFMAMLILSTATALVYGTALALVDLRMDRDTGSDLSLSRRIIRKGLAYTAVFVVITFGSLFAFDRIMAEWVADQGVSLTHEALLLWGLVAVPSTLAGNFLISFINQVSRSFGPGMLPALLLGRYRKPVRERRIFMFMDLKSSTRHAEELGAERYSAMIRDLFLDADSEVPGHDAEIYQYVGDEVVFTWNAEALSDKQQCLRFYFAVERAIADRAEYYQRTYDRIPTFKAGLHVGDVVAVEVGGIKREIAYHGDTINTAARIQSVCNELGRPLIISDDLLKECVSEKGPFMRTEELGTVLLRGKQNQISIHAVHGFSSHAIVGDPPPRLSRTIHEV